MLKRAALFFIKVYQDYIRRVIPRSCRFIPSCSEYTKLAIEKYGILIGIAKGVRRVASCQPFFGKYGYDPLD